MTSYHCPRRFRIIAHTAIASALLVTSYARAESLRFAVIGDYGDPGPNEEDVATLVRSWNPDLLITTGDNNYTGNIDANVGQYYHEFISPYVGSFGHGSETNRMFPSLGNHDWDEVLDCNGSSCSGPYLEYFTLPGNGRYYDFVAGPVHFFALDSDDREPDGNTSSSVQGRWLQNRLASSTARWKILYCHHPPYSSALHGSSLWMQWPFHAWGATAVLAGHDHTYERIIRDAIPYFVNGLGGRMIYSFRTPVDGSEVRYNDDYGAMVVQADETMMTFQFISRDGAIIDSYVINATPVETTSWGSIKAMYR